MNIWLINNQVFFRFAEMIISMIHFNKVFVKNFDNLLIDCCSNLERSLGMLEHIKKGKLLEQGINLYHKKDFVKANVVFNEALSIDVNDFAVNFWMARTQTMLGSYVSAKELLNKCRELKPKVIELLIVPWEALIDSLENNENFTYEQLSQCNIETDNNLYTCYFKKQYSFKELLIISLIWFVGNAIVGVGEQSYSVVEFAALLIPIIQLCYFHFNTVLPLNLWLRYQWVKEQIHRLIFNTSFILFTIGFIVVFAIVLDRSIIKTIHSLPREIAYEAIQELCQKMWIGVPSLLLSGPISGELTCCLVWYNYLAKYNKYVAYFGVSLLTMLLLFSPTRFFMSLGLIWAYNRYKSIMSPIVIHFLIGFYFLIRPLVYKILFF